MAHYKGAASEGTRAANLIKKREKKKEEFDLLKQRIQEEQNSGGKLEAIGSKFSTSYDLVEEKLKTSTIGLVTLDEMREKQETLMKERELELAAANAALTKAAERKEAAKRSQLKAKTTLSFQFDDDEEEEDDEEGWGGKRPVETITVEEKSPAFKKRKIKKNPEVDTSFLPDRDREEEEAREREELRQKWIEEQDTLKNEDISITFSYWDGSGHRRTVAMKKGNTIREFLQKGLEALRKDFSELRVVAVDQLMYIKEDLIIPQHYSFYDFIVNKARGKSGPLFSFDVHEDVRLTNDATMEKEESHAGKVVLRSWYERNKHIFPASRWEAYDPEKKWEKYTISDGPKPK